MHQCITQIYQWPGFHKLTHNTTDYTQDAATFTHTAAVCKSVPSKDSVSHLLQRQYLIGAYTKRPSHIMRYIRQSSNWTYITALHAVPAVGRSRLFTNRTTGDHRPRRTACNVCGPDSFSNQHLFHNPTCKTELLCRFCVWVLSLCLSGLSRLSGEICCLHLQCQSEQNDNAVGMYLYTV